MKLTPWVFISGAVLCLLAVLIGAFGAHALQAQLVENDKLTTFDTASQYHFFHAFALLLVSIIDMPRALLSTQRFVSLCFIVGVCIFSGSLYLLSITNIAFLGVLTPVGGVVLLMAWVGMMRIGFKWNYCE